MIEAWLALAVNIFYVFWNIIRDASKEFSQDEEIKRLNRLVERHSNKINALEKYIYDKR